MAAKKKLPKRPKHKASLQTWENYHKKVADVKRHNSQVESDKKKKAALISKRIS